MKAKKNSKKRLNDFEHDPLEEELDFNDLVTVAVGPGWAQVPRHLRSPKHLREARAWLARKERWLKNKYTENPATRRLVGKFKAFSVHYEGRRKPRRLNSTHFPF